METRLYVDIRPYFHSEMIELYGATKSTFNKDLEPHRALLGPRIGHRWSIRQVEIIFELFGRPYRINTE